MSRPAPMLICQLREERLLFTPNIIEPFLADLVARGYRLITTIEMSETPFFHVWWFTLRNRIEEITSEQRQQAGDVFEPGISPSLREQMDASFATQNCYIEFRAFNVTSVLEFTVEIGGSEEPYLTASADRDYLDNSYEANGLTAYERWIDIVKLIYHHLHPLYAWTYDFDFLYADNSNISREEFLSGNIHSLTLINIFGPELVQQYGRERVLATPIWRIDQFEDSGLLLLPEPYWLNYAPVWRKASHHLGIKTNTYRYVAHLASLLQEHGLLSNISVELLQEATSKTCVLEVLMTLIPQHFILDEERWASMKDIHDRIAQHAAGTRGEWTPEHIHTTTKDTAILIEFDFQEHHYRWLCTPGFYEFQDKLNHFAQINLDGRFIKMDRYNSDKKYILYLHRSLAIALHNLLLDLKSGWPTINELCQLFPTIGCEQWKSIVPAQPEDMDFSIRDTPTPCCDAQYEAYRIELCSLVRHGLSHCRGW